MNDVKKRNKSVLLTVISKINVLFWERENLNHTLHFVLNVLVKLIWNALFWVTYNSIYRLKSISALSWNDLIKKLVGISAKNINTNFEGSRRKETKNLFCKLLFSTIDKTFFDLCCMAHIVNTIVALIMLLIHFDYWCVTVNYLRVSIHTLCKWQNWRIFLNILTYSTLPQRLVFIWTQDGLDLC